MTIAITYKRHCSHRFLGVVQWPVPETPNEIAIGVALQRTGRPCGPEDDGPLVLRNRSQTTNLGRTIIETATFQEPDVRGTPKYRMIQSL